MKPSAASAKVGFKSLVNASELTSFTMFVTDMTSGTAACYIAIELKSSHAGAFDKCKPFKAPASDASNADCLIASLLAACDEGVGCPQPC